MLTYSRPYQDGSEAAAVARVIESGMWTGGTTVAAFEDDLRAALGARQAVCLSSGTAAIQALLHLVRKRHRPGLVVTSSLNFVAVASAAVREGYDLACTDIDPDTLNMDPVSLRAVLGRLAAAYSQIIVFPVHFAGLPCDMRAIAEVAADFGAAVAEDACHALQVAYAQGGPTVGNHPDSLGAAFSFHPTKPVAAGEGGALTLRDPELAERVRAYRNHSMRRSDPVNRSAGIDPRRGPNPWYYEVDLPGSNLRMSDLHAAIGRVQLARLPESWARRRELAGRYLAVAADLAGVRLFSPADTSASAHHLLPAQFDLIMLRMTKREVYEFFLERGVRLQLHYTPIHAQPAFAKSPTVSAFGFPVLDRVLPGLFSLPLYYGMTDADAAVVHTALTELSRRATRP